MKIDGFVVAMLAAVGLAFAFPWLGAEGGPVPAGLITEIGIAIVFFMHGAALSPAALKLGAANWRLHLFIQAATFILFPLIGFAVYFGARSLLADEVRLGFLFLCALPSTMSSSVAMTSLGRGNVPGAVFNASLSGLIGMVVTPLLVGLVTAAGGTRIPILPAILDVMQKLLLPFVAGQLARPLVGGWIGAHKPLVGKLDRAVILLIVFTAFCESVSAGLWWRYSPFMLIEITLLIGLLLGVVLGLTTVAARLFGFSREDEVAAVFCGSKKSLANGAPMAKILFGAAPTLGMIMLPVMIYHQLQLIVCSILARRYAERAAAAGQTI